MQQNIDQTIDLNILRYLSESTMSSKCPYPVGSVYISVDDINPGAALGGEWVKFAEGKTLVGFDSSNEDYNALLKTGGEKEHTMTIDELPSHKHTYTSGGTPTCSEDGEHKHGMMATKKTRPDGGSGSSGGSNYFISTYVDGDTVFTTTSWSGGDHSHTWTPKGSMNENGSSTPFNIMQPYIVVSFWHRVA